MRRVARSLAILLAAYQVMIAWWYGRLVVVWLGFRFANAAHSELLEIALLGIWAASSLACGLLALLPQRSTTFARRAARAAFPAAVGAPVLIAATDPHNPLWPAALPTVALWGMWWRFRPSET